MGVIETDIANLSVLTSSLGPNEDGIGPKKDHFIRGGTTLCDWVTGDIEARVETNEYLSIQDAREYLDQLPADEFTETSPVCPHCWKHATVLYSEIRTFEQTHTE